MLWGRRWRHVTIVAGSDGAALMAQQLDDLSRSPTPLDQDSTIIAVIEMSQATWLVAGIVPGIERHPLKKIEPNEVKLLCLLMRWRAEAIKKGRTITRIVVGLRGWARRVLAGALASGPRHRKLRHPPDQRGCLARASPGKNRSARHRIAQTRLHRVAAR